MALNYGSALVSLDVYEEQPKQEYVKCVVVGDTAVGKTRLICSYVYDQPGLPVSSFCHKPHIPTVFAIDQYVSDPAIRKRAKTTISGVHVQLRIWDTFGDHEKNRKFALQNANVIVLCYSIGSIYSLRNVNSTWYPEIKKYCPRVPIILVGTQLDRRYSDPLLFNSQVTTLTDLLSMRFKGFPDVSSNFSKWDVLSHTCVPPEVGRQTSREINASLYQEVSVVTKYGVNEVFENAIKAALIYRRQSKPLFSSHLKQITKPSMINPYLPPKPIEPKILINNNFSYGYKLLSNQTNNCDVKFIVEDQEIPAHTIVLLTASPVLRLLLSHPKVLDCIGYCEPMQSDFNIDSLETTDGYINGVKVSGIPRGFQSIDIASCQNIEKTIYITVENVCQVDFKQVVEFLYTNAITGCFNWMELLKTATYLQESLLCKYLSNILNNEDFCNPVVLNEFHNNRKKYHKLLCRTMVFADVAFLVENVLVPAHKQVLISQSPMMSGMFREGNFKESTVHTVS